MSRNLCVHLESLLGNRGVVTQGVILIFFFVMRLYRTLLSASEALFDVHGIYLSFLSFFVCPASHGQD